MKKKFILLTIISFASFDYIRAQTTEVIASAGSSGAGSVTSIDWTLGETAIATLTSSTITLTQGFHQPFLSIIPVDVIDDQDISIIVFPNPIGDYLFIELPEDDFCTYIIQLYDLNGKLLETQKSTADRCILNLNERPDGSYILTVSKSPDKTRTFKIIKNQASP